MVSVKFVDGIWVRCHSASGHPPVLKGPVAPVESLFQLKAFPRPFACAASDKKTCMRGEAGKGFFTCSLCFSSSPPRSSCAVSGPSVEEMGRGMGRLFHGQ